MGISGLLPILKPIQNQKHLSEFSGQTLAVDAYVWLHRGVYACATDLAMGKKTTKYVDYAMHRVRLLLHHNIQPFIVFDGGPLPAKAPTEILRKKRREENLAMGQDLVKRGKWKEARDYFVRAVDVGTGMAFQFIKALKAEGIPYIVAPYEADAQLAYLERLGIVDGIITEDSDLLVFGCKTVLFKLDAVSQTVISISQNDFAAVDGSNGSGISLQTFTPSQFRQMCMLSGCDYLPSIPGVGLKTAYTLLRTHKTVENVVRAVRLEGKKNVPKDYAKMFYLAEKAFFYQRVWDPFQEKLVCLTDVPEGEELDKEADCYVGCDLPPALAKQIAEGDVCPISLQPINDMNPDYAPRPSKRAPLASTSLNRSSSKSNGGASVPQDKGLLNYFALKSKGAPVPRKKTPSRAKSSAMIVGRASGKRTLVEVMDLEMEVKRKKQRDEDFISDISSTETRKLSNRSRFFERSASASAATGWSREGVAGPSRLAFAYEETLKENMPVGVDDEECIYEEEKSIAKQCGDLEGEVKEEISVAQEDGYISPTHSIRWDTPDLSSPPKLGARKNRNVADDDFFGADAISSPIRRRSYSATRSGSDVRTVKQSLSSRLSDAVDVAFDGIDLCDTFGDEEEDNLTSDFEYRELCPENSFSSTNSGSTSTSTSGPVTLHDSGLVLLEGDDTRLDVDFDVEEEVIRESKIKQEIVASGWWQKWARASASEKSLSKEQASTRTRLRRSETTITPDGKTVQRQKPYNPSSVNQVRAPPMGQANTEAATMSTAARPHRAEQPMSRKSLAFQEMRRAPAGPGDDSFFDFDSPAEPGSLSSPDEAGLPLDEVISRARGRLAQFRLGRKDRHPGAGLPEGSRPRTT